MSTPDLYPKAEVQPIADRGADLFAWLQDVARAQGVGHFGARVAMVLSGYFSRSERAAWPKLTTLAAALDASPEGVRKALLQLRAAGFLEIEYGDGRGRLNVYRMRQNPQPLEGDTEPEPPTAVGPLGGKAPLAVGGLAPEPPTAVGQNPQQPFAHGTRELEPGNPTQGRLKTRASRRRSETELPDGFPTGELIDQARARFEAEGLHLDAHLEAEKFRGHHASKGTRFVSWEAAWLKTWTGNAITFERRRATRPAGGRPSGTEWAMQGLRR